MNENQRPMHAAGDTVSRCALGAVLLSLLLSGFPSPGAIGAAAPSLVNAEQGIEPGQTPAGLTTAEWQSIRQAIGASDVRVTTEPWTQKAKLGHEDSRQFGRSVAISGDTIVVGAPFGLGQSAFVFEKGDGWGDGQPKQVARLKPDDGDDDDWFGRSVAISGDTIVVGAYHEDLNGSQAGSAYVFEKDGGWSDGDANQVAKLDPDDGDSEDKFGCSVAISGDTIVVGAVKDENPNGYWAGAAYVFEKGDGWGDGNANQVAKLDPDDGETHDRFGHSVAITGDTIVVGARFDDNPNGDSAGSAYVFERGAGWADGHANQVAKLIADDGDRMDDFGCSVSITVDTIVVGARMDYNRNGDAAGAAYVFERGSGWGDGHANQMAKLVPDDDGDHDHFGNSVGVSGTTIVVGADWDDDPNGFDAGSAYVFEEGAGWDDGHANQVAKLIADDGGVNDEFGESVAIDSDTIVVGAWLMGEAAYVFTPAAANQAPTFTSTPVTAGFADVTYLYAIVASDTDAGDDLTITAPVLPAWLALGDHGDGTATLSGTPGELDVGDHAVALQVRDSGGLTDTQSFSVTVSAMNGTYVFLPLLLRASESGPPTGWVTLVDEDFEGAFPGAWELDESGTGEYTWARRDCEANGGKYSGWAVGGGRDGSALDCGASYPDSAQSWMVYGPFSLADATEADLSLRLWTYAEAGNDWLCWACSTDDEHYYGPRAWGDSQGWREEGLDLTDVPELGDVTGEPQVWIALIFSSNANTNFAEGAYVDDIVLRKFVSGTTASAAETRARQPAAGRDTMIAVSTDEVIRRP